MSTPSVHFVCVKNSGKPQMAAGLMRRIAGDTVVVRSAGTKPGEVLNAISVQVLAESGIDISDEKPRQIDARLVASADVVVTIGREATSPQSRASASTTGIPMSRPNAESTGSSACASSETT